jgi:prepilin-type N-terminal cleavage/methylation domain-containing protein
MTRMWIQSNPTAGSGAMRRTERSAFTLIELLVVIAIIALLITILMPSLHQARELARAAICLHDQRNCGLAVLLYANDNNGKFGHVDHRLDRLFWCEFLFDTGYAQRGDMLLCPSHPPGTFSADWQVYGWRWAFYPSGTLEEEPHPTESGPWYVYLDLQAFDRPDLFVPLIDSNASGGNPGQNARWYSRGPRPKKAHLRHQGRTQGWALDGHAEALGPDELLDRDIRIWWDEEYHEWEDGVQID